ncbi:hypothetical protein [Xanthobacter sp. ZOL 2024]
MTGRQRTDWEAIERDYRAGSLSIREIGRKHGVSDTAIRKEAKARGWKRDLAEKVRKAVREEVVRATGSQASSQEQRATDAEIVETAKWVGVEVQLSHRRDLQQLHALKRIISGRLAVYLDGGEPDGPFMGEKESPGDLLEKLSRVTSRLIPLERQAHNLDDEAVKIEHTGKSGGVIEVAAMTTDEIRERLKERGLPTRIFDE